MLSSLPSEPDLSPVMDAKWSLLEQQALAIEKNASRTGPTADLEATIRSAELYLQALRLVDKPSDRKRLDVKCKELLARAEKIKNGSYVSPTSPSRIQARRELKAPVSARKLTTRESIIILAGSKLNGFVFKPWTSAPQPDEFLLQEGQEPFTDSPFLPLSSEQLETFGGWKRAEDAISSINNITTEQRSPFKPMMHADEPMDLVQDLTSDCSVVASLCAGVSRVQAGHPKILRSIVHPYDFENDRISFSPNRKYVLKLYFNGCWRRVEIDDFLPSSKSSRVLHVIDRRNPGLLWPALVEKAYLKVRGGYDFPGSNSGTDLAVLTGWLPQQVFLHDEGVEPDRLWEEIVTNFADGNVLITIGTGKLPRREQKYLGLAAEHDYAVLALSSNKDVREILVKNPWADGDVWKGASRRRPNQDDGSGTSTSDEEMLPGTFWMEFNSMFNYFENMYINWNPGLFTNREDLHFSWQQQDFDQIGNVLVDNPQFAVVAEESSEVWLLLSRHFRTGDYSQATVGKNGYISIYLYERQGKKVLASSGAKLRGPFVDSPNTLLRFRATAQTAYTAVVAFQELPPGKMNFTLSASSKCPVTVSEARLQYPERSTIKSSWNRSTSGGNSDSPNYLANPQFRIRLGIKQRLALLLRVKCDEKQESNIHVKMLLVFSDGSRIVRLRPRAVLAHSGDYRRGSAVLETELDPGNYTIICSTFDTNQHADFMLEFYSNEKTPLTQLPPDGSGRLSIRSAPAVLDTNTDRLLAPLTIKRMSRATFVARHETPFAAAQSLFKMTLEQGQGPYKQVLASSKSDNEEFTSVSSGLRVGDVDLHPSMCSPETGGLWLVLERLSQGQASPRVETLEVETFTDEKLEMGPWGLGEG
ncbi:cysteine protease [Rhinocladiella similis]